MEKGGKDHLVSVSTEPEAVGGAQYVVMLWRELSSLKTKRPRGWGCENYTARKISLTGPKSRLQSIVFY